MVYKDHPRGEPKQNEKERAVMIRIFLLVIILISSSVSAHEEKKPIKPLPKERKQSLVRYLKDNWKSPEDYVVGKFVDYDLIFIGEYHRIKHDVGLIHNLIPRLYEAGIYAIILLFWKDATPEE